MGLGIYLCLFTIILLVVIIGGASFIKKQSFYMKNPSSCGKTAGEVAELMLEAYGINDKDNESDTNSNTAQNILDNNLEETSADGIPENKSKYIEVIKGKLIFKTKTGNNFGMQMSEDIYNSNDLMSLCTASYEATKLCESLNKPFIFKLISFISFIPKIINCFSWLLCLMVLFGMIGILKETFIYIGIISFISVLITCLEALYNFEIIKTCLTNIEALELITETEKQEVIENLNKIAFIDFSSTFKTFKWFFGVVLGYGL